MSKVKIIPINSNSNLVEMKKADVFRIVSVCKGAGYSISRLSAFEIWGDYSKSLHAGWMTLPEKDSDLLLIILHWAWYVG